MYYREAIALSAPVDFMSTLATDKLYDEAQAAQPADVPANGSPLDMSAGGKVYHLTDMFPLAEGNELDVVVKYQAADVSNTTRTFQENTAVIKALVAKFPEFRESLCRSGSASRRPLRPRLRYANGDEGDQVIEPLSD